MKRTRVNTRPTGIRQKPRKEHLAEASEEDRIFAENLFRLRKSLNKTQRALAAEIGTSDFYISRMEGGVPTPTLNPQQMVASWCEVDLNRMYKEELSFRRCPVCKEIEVFRGNPPEMPHCSTAVAHIGVVSRCTKLIAGGYGD